MLFTRRKDGSLLFETRWNLFVGEWRAATQIERVVLDDGRPAIRREPSPEDEDGDVTYTTLAPALWDRIKSRQREAFALTPPPKRVRLCQACRGQMTVTREYEDVWCFSCPRCHSSETWGKDLLGGVPGAGEREKR